MAPEVLNQSINMNDFGAFQRADVYAVGLLLWEVTNVICDEKGILICAYFSYWKSTNILVECLVSPVEYQPPYYYLVSADPQFEEMEELICAKKMRPFQKEGWETCEVMKILSMLQVCYYHHWPIDMIIVLFSVNAGQQTQRLDCPCCGSKNHFLSVKRLSERSINNVVEIMTNRLKRWK